MRLQHLGLAALGALLSGCGGSQPASTAEPTTNTDPTEADPTAMPEPASAEPAADAAVVILVQGDERWMGNDTYRDTGDPDLIVGAFPALPEALTALSEGAPGAHMALAAFHGTGGAAVLHPLGASPDLVEGLGEQRDFARNIGTPLISAVHEARLMLANSDAERKVLVVFGDGNGLREDIRRALDQARSALQELGAHVYTIQYDTGPARGGPGAETMRKLGYSGSYQATSRGELPTYAASIAAEIGAAPPAP